MVSAWHAKDESARSRTIFNATTEKLNDVTQVSLTGEIDSSTAPQLESHLNGILKAAEIMVLVDFSRLDFISSAGLRVFLSYAKRIRKAGGKIALAGMSQPVQKVFESVGFTSIFQIYETSSDALGFFNPHGGRTE